MLVRGVNYEARRRKLGREGEFDGRLRGEVVFLLLRFTWKVL
jgi:hypothetical protein